MTGLSPQSQKNGTGTGRPDRSESPFHGRHPRHTVFLDIRRTRGLGSYGRQTVGNCPRKPRSGERGYGLGECLPVFRSLSRCGWEPVPNLHNLGGDLGPISVFRPGRVSFLQFEPTTSIVKMYESKKGWGTVMRRTGHQPNVGRSRWGNRTCPLFEPCPDFRSRRVEPEEAGGDAALRRKAP